MNIVDVFPYFIEKELLELRVRLLYDHVDKFIICEANRTHKGQPREYTLRKTLIELNLPLDKITVVEVDLSMYDNELNNWTREREQRNAVGQFITINDICIVSDCDEIIDPNRIQYYVMMAKQYPDNILRIPMVLLHNRADLQVHTIDKSGREIRAQWTSPFICLKSHLKRYTLSQIRESNAFQNFDFMLIDFKDLFLYDNNIIENAGWHFSWMGNAEKLIVKYDSVCHANDMPGSINMKPDEEAKDFLRHYHAHENGNDAMGRKDHVLKPYDINLLPKLIFELPDVHKLLLPNAFEEDWFNFPKLYSYVIDKFPSGSKFVEVGSWKGQSATFMCEHIAKANKDIEFFCVDTWEGSVEHASTHDLTNLYEKFLYNMKPYEKYYFPLKLDSIIASRKFKDKSLDFVFIDAAHDYESAKNDIIAWLPKIKNGGILAGHDYYPDNPEFCGVYQAVNEIFSQTEITQVGDCFVIEINETN